MSELRGSDSTEQPHEADRPSQADQVARIKELNAIGDAKAFDPRIRPYDPLEHIRPGDRPRSDDEGSSGPAVSRPPGDAPTTVERPRLGALADRVRQLSAERFEQPESDEPSPADTPRQADELSDAERLAGQLDAGDEPPEPEAPDVDEPLRDWDRAENPFSPLGGPDSRYNPDLPDAEQTIRIEEGLDRTIAVLGKRPINAEYAGRVYFDEWSDALKAKYPDGIRYSYEGFPEFARYATAIVELEDGFGPTRRGDNRRARAQWLEETGEKPDEKNRTWHHHEDGRTLMLLPTDLHGNTYHSGGWTVTEKLGTQRTEETERDA